MSRDDYAILQQSAEWFAVLSSGRVSEGERRAWQDWLAASPAHAAAWHKVEAISQQFERLPAEVQRSAARAALHGGARSRRQVLGGLLLLGGGALVALSTAKVAPWRAWMAQQRTAIGEIRETRLADGSQLWLNSHSAVDVAYGASLRQLRLHRGELWLDSAPDRQRPPRPLVVDTAEGRLRALGTRFSVRQGEGFSQLAVFDGAVEVSPLACAPQVVRAGQQVRFEATRIGAVEAAAQNRQAWRKGMLVADNMRLGDFIAELAEHFPGYLGCDPRVADLRLVGAYPLADRERILAALETSLPVKVQRRWPWWVSVEPA
ncbi:Protein FecR [compost metagenome]